MKRSNLYHELSRPYPDHGSAVAALDAFAEDLAELRKKHRIADVCVVMAVTAKDEEVTSMVGLGDQLKALTLLARAYGAAQEKLRRLLARLASTSDGDEG